MSIATIVTERFRLTSTSGEHILGDLRWLPTRGSGPMVIMLHGFTGFKDWGFFPYVATELAQRGACVVTFNFSLSGYIEGSDRVERPELFARNTIRQEIEDTVTVLTALLKRTVEAPPSWWKRWNKQLFLLGYSRGAGVALIVLREHPQLSVQRLALWSPVTTFHHYTERQKKRWRQRGTLEISHTRTSQILLMNVQYLDDLEANKERYNLFQAMASLRCPTLVVHGMHDITVPLRSVQELAAAAPPGMVQLHVLPHTGHTLGVDHPMRQPSPAVVEATAVTAAFFGL
ncbi:MAG: alpha/beta hydrolase fold domain-containing protein [Chlorobiota bacterium]